jgi:hypothetical protein
MFSLLRKGLVYKDISPDIVEHDQDIDADQWVYDDREVYRGRFDPRYTEYNLNVYWLYDDNLNRVGLAEHDADNQADYKALWFYKNPFATLYQDESWETKDKTVWSLMSNEAYQDCLEDDFKTVFDRCLSSKYRLVTPEFLITPPTVYECTKCGKKSLQKLKNCTSVIETPYFSTSNLLFIDESFVLYERSTQHQPQLASYEQEQTVQLQEEGQESVTHTHPEQLPLPSQAQQPEIQFEAHQSPLQFQTDQQHGLESSGIAGQHEASK